MSLMMADLFKNAFKGNRKHKNNTCIPQGIPNVGNTCYINSVIQVLKWTPGFQSRLDTCQKESQLALDVEKIMNVTDKRKLRSILKSLGTSIGRNTLTSGNQEDCFELYNALTENLHSSDDKCPAKLFEGSFLMTFSYESCGHIERQLQTFTSLSLPIMDTREAEKGNDDYGMKKMDFAEEKQEVIEKGEEEKIKERKGKIEDEGKVHELVKGVVGKEGGGKVKNLTVFKEENAENEKMVIKKGKVDQEKGNVGKEKTELVKVTKVKVDNGEDANKDVERGREKCGQTKEGKGRESGGRHSEKYERCRRKGERRRKKKGNKRRKGGDRCEEGETIVCRQRGE
ncbi:ubiquitin carboxyl-terminal hydrolase 35-like [Pecten maximus]|uniref:ubiquitin carboxyl-terminal hydrolase 35-like n=1 Tax=Pecten maximus TaxID=6579 RepID=UPI001457E7E5|nr:ubiquitin carboxyl-terminal hydrolase 35-like [Pecten maximus]